MKKIVVIGGGNGASLTLNALKTLGPEYDLTGVIAVSDSGGSSGKLRQELQVLPPGDLLRAILALSEFDFSLLKKIFYQNRFINAGALSEHNLGNIFLTLAGKYSDPLSAITALGQALQIRGTVLPVTLDQVTLCAELTSGETIKGEANIDVPTLGPNKIIKQVYLEPVATAIPEVITALEQADVIILGGGDVYTSMVAALLPQGISEALKKNNTARIVLVSNRYYHLNGEYVSHTVSEIISELEKYLPRPIDTIVVDPTLPTESELAAATAKTWGIKHYDPAQIQANCAEGAFDAATVGIDPEALGKILKRVIG